MIVKKDFRDLGVVKANPFEYVDRFGDSLRVPPELPDFVKDIRPPQGVILAAEYLPAPVPELEGDVEALRLVDLDREGLTEYKPQVGLGHNPHPALNAPYLPRLPYL